MTLDDRRGRRAKHYGMGEPPRRELRDGAGAQPGRTLVMVRAADDTARVYMETADGKRSEFPQALVHHSDGYEFGYGGSGPADLALNVLALVTHEAEAWRLHQDFKWATIARVPQDGGRLPLADVLAWVQDYWRCEAGGILPVQAATPAGVVK